MLVMNICMLIRTICQRNIFVARAVVVIGLARFDFMAYQHKYKQFYFKNSV